VVRWTLLFVLAIANWSFPDEITSIPASTPLFNEALLRRLRVHANLADKNRQTAVHAAILGLPKRAAEYDYIIDAVASILTLLAYCGVDTTQKDREGLTAWQIYETGGFVELLPEDVEMWLRGQPPNPKLLLRAQHYLTS